MPSRLIILLRSSIRHAFLAALLPALICIATARNVAAVNSVVVESKTFAPGQTACSVGVFITNDVPLLGFVVPLELRSISGGAYVNTQIPGSFKFGVIPGNRLDHSPLGTAGASWPDAVRSTYTYGEPFETNGWCMNRGTSYSKRTASIDGVSPDGVMHATFSIGDPSAGEWQVLNPGADSASTEGASLLFVFNVDSLSGCIRVDTCCITPANSLAGVDIDNELVDFFFVEGAVSVGGVECPPDSADHNTYPHAVCRGALDLGADSTGMAVIEPSDLNRGSWDAEDGTNLDFSMEPPSPLPIGRHSVRLTVCDRLDLCASCNCLVFVHPVGYEPTSLCRDSVVVDIESGCTAVVPAEACYTGAWDEIHGPYVNVRFVGHSTTFRVGTTPVTLEVNASDGARETCQSKVVVNYTGLLQIEAHPDTLSLRYTGISTQDTLSQRTEFSGATCGGRMRIAEYGGLLLGVSHWLDGTPPRVWVNLNTTVARLVPSGLYPGWIVVENPDNLLRDTIYVAIWVDHPPGQEPEPTCDSICGIVLDLDGDPVQGAKVAGYICDSNEYYCGKVSNVTVFSDSDGAFCIPTHMISGLRLQASLYPVGIGFNPSPTCTGPTNYVYLVPCERCWGGGPQSGGPEFGMNNPPCVSEGFVYSRHSQDSILPLSGATAELWDSYPGGTILKTDVSDEFGYFMLGQASGELLVRAEGHCPQLVPGFVCGYEPIPITLSPVSYVDLPNWPYFCDYYASDASFVAEGVDYLVQSGDVIYATDPQGGICGITSVSPDSSGTYLIHVLGDDPETTEDEGAVEGDSVTLWLNCECAVVAPQTWVNFGSFQFDALWDCEVVPLCCVLCEGWNMWSHNIAHPSYARPDVLATIDLSYDAVRSGLCDYGSISWFDGRPINDLNDVSPWFGYDIHMLQGDTVCLEGEPVDPSTPINLCVGWNYVPYLPESADNLSHALQSLDGNVSHIFTMYCDYGVASWNVAREPQNNDLNCLEPCKGYWIEMNSDDTLVYPEPDGCDPLAKVGVRAFAGRVTATPLVADYYTPSSTIAEGGVISVRSTSGTLIGEADVGENGSFLIHVYGDVPFTTDVEGAVHGEVLTFEIDGVAAATSREIRWVDRDNQLITLNTGAIAAIPTEYALLQNYPNPFNAGTVISFDLKDESAWTLTVYNVMGQRVRDFTGQSTAGRISVRWDGRAESGQQLASGVYFYRLSANEFTDFKKMMLVK